MPSWTVPTSSSWKCERGRGKLPADPAVAPTLTLRGLSAPRVGFSLWSWLLRGGHEIVDTCRWGVFLVVCFILCGNHNSLSTLLCCRYGEMLAVSKVKASVLRVCTERAANIPGEVPASLAYLRPCFSFSAAAVPHLLPKVPISGGTIPRVLPRRAGRHGVLVYQHLPPDQLHVGERDQVSRSRTLPPHHPVPSSTRRVSAGRREAESHLSHPHPEESELSQPPQG